MISLSYVISCYNISLRYFFLDSQVHGLWTFASCILSSFNKPDQWNISATWLVTYAFLSDTSTPDRKKIAVRSWHTYLRHLSKWHGLTEFHSRDEITGNHAWTNVLSSLDTLDLWLLSQIATSRYACITNNGRVTSKMVKMDSVQGTYYLSKENNLKLTLRSFFIIFISFHRYKQLGSYRFERYIL